MAVFSDALRISAFHMHRTYVARLGFIYLKDSAQLGYIIHFIIFVFMADLLSDICFDMEKVKKL